MKKRKIHIGDILAIIGILGLILNTEISIVAGREALILCIQTVIPSLFPFLFLTGIINNSTTYPDRSFSFVEKICKIPAGSGTLYMMSLLGGYPIGAQLIGQRIRSNAISAFQAYRMMTFANNAGPAFIFGICGMLFSAWYIPFMIWGIQIISSLLIASILPGKYEKVDFTDTPRITARVHLHNAIQSMAYICGWIILFRILLSIGNYWFTGALSPLPRILLTGTAELTNGCLELSSVENQALRFVLCTGMLSFGGLCVTMQTSSVFPELPMGVYILGKSTQSAVCIAISLLLQYVIFPRQNRLTVPYYIWCILAVTVCLLFFILYRKISVEKKKNIVYNQEKHI